MTRGKKKKEEKNGKISFFIAPGCTYFAKQRSLVLCAEGDQGKAGADLDVGWVQGTAHARAPGPRPYSCTQRQCRPGCVTHPGTIMKLNPKRYPKNEQDKQDLVCGKQLWFS